MINKHTLRSSECKILISFLLTLLISFKGFSSHIFGGNIGIIQVDKNLGKFKLALNIYVDMTTSGTAELASLQTTPLVVKIFRKSDNQPIETHSLGYLKFFDLVYDNATCSLLKNLKTREYSYQKEVLLDLLKFTDSNGYYLVWTRCCRNGDIDNIVLPDKTGLTLYAEFPALKNGGNNVEYSSPIFPVPNGEYICKGKPFKLDLGAVTTITGDELKYSLVTPYGSQNTGTTFNADIKAGPYPSVQWQSGYSPNKTILGNPALSIEQSTGIVNVTASVVGLFVFTIQCDHFRNGIKLGSVRHDFQLPVVDCALNTPPVPVVTYNSINVTDINYCQGENIELITSTAGGTWNFQWKKDGDNIIGATLPTLKIAEKGQYSVTKSFKTACANDTTSQIVNVKEALDLKLKVSKKKFCESDTALATALVETGTIFEWFKNTTSLGNAPQIVIDQAGKYVLIGQKSGTTCIGKDSIDVIINPKPVVPLISSTPFEFCQNDSVKIYINDNSTYDYQWLKSSSNINKATKSFLWVKQQGDYYLKIKDRTTSCESQTNAFVVNQAAMPTIKFDSIPSVCKGAVATINLTAQPSGGVFTWNYAVINNFDVASNSVGRYDVIYSIKKGNCNVDKKRVVEIKSVGCGNISSTNNGRIIIPTAFTPNNDGTNETWEIFNIQQYPEAEILIYNRWGDPVFYSKGYTQPFDGTKDGKPLPEGAYAYTITLDDTKRPLTGTITILR